jgi:type IV secretory pathway protease TraF
MTGRVIVLATVAMAVAAIGATMDSQTTPRFIWNASASIPIGLYKVRPAHHLTVTALAVAYPPESLARWLEEGRYLPRGVPLIIPFSPWTGRQSVVSAPSLRSMDARWASRMKRTTADARFRSGRAVA